MNLKHINRSGETRSFLFDEDGKAVIVGLPVAPPSFGFDDTDPALTKGSPAEVDEFLPKQDVVLTYKGRTRVLKAVASILLYYAEQAEVPLQVQLEERYRQPILSIFTNHDFLDVVMLDKEVADLIKQVKHQVPVRQEEPEERPVGFDPLDHIEEGAVPIYYEEGNEEGLSWTGVGDE